MSNVGLFGSGRVWTIKFRAGPTHEPFYHADSMLSAIDWAQGDVNKIEQPSDVSYNQWIEIQSYQSSADRATSTITSYEHFDRSRIMELIRLRCSFDVQLHQGTCEDPTDFNAGWMKVIVFEDAKATSLGGSDLGALEGGSQDKVTEEMPFSARDIYNILRMAFKEVAKTEVGEEVVAVDVCDLVTCGECEGTGGDGCQKVFAVTNSATSSPGVKPQVIITTDQYTSGTIIERWVTTVLLTENVNEGTCVGTYFIVLSSDGAAIHFAPTQDMIDQVETWTKVTTGIVAGAGPVKAWNYSPLTTFICGLNGYIYLMKNPADGVTVLDAAANTTEDFHDISGWDATNVGAVGLNDAFVYSVDGYTFALGTPPAATTNLYAIAYRRENEIWVGGDTGSVYTTYDYGDHWTTKSLPGSLTQIDDIVWASDTVGFVAGRTAAPAAQVLRTIDGGYSWYVMPESTSLSIPAADYINELAVCSREVNKLFGGGLADNAADGFLFKATD
jgi:photosystem II stability/assembly factor-like uncharacterized protein